MKAFGSKQDWTHGLDESSAPPAQILRHRHITPTRPHRASDNPFADELMIPVTGEVEPDVDYVPTLDFEIEELDVPDENLRITVVTPMSLPAQPRKREG